MVTHDARKLLATISEGVSNLYQLAHFGAIRSRPREWTSSKSIADRLGYRGFRHYTAESNVRASHHVFGPDKPIGLKYFYCAVMPASITCSAPVMYEASSDARKSTKLDTSPGSAIRPSGIMDVALPPLSSVASTIIGVRMKPG